ncbi:hypothetical protein MMH89_03140 [Candidatus Comchoanobacter bicostacola]|uniref:Uncharacterized protein n=1 Tax=Candidatus Comchoanobacter bicostacola TaxID=2919598 RepID=A0ABY5DK68_9GAMM|nr:hypothetical protein [Candidatus Comchoanobacter bicostacola]UTC24217.1 hypothetical protein MMH89_03140 [Candidatus Comchoanobacter bicostacola]
MKKNRMSSRQSEIIAAHKSEFSEEIREFVCRSVVPGLDEAHVDMSVVFNHIHEHFLNSNEKTVSSIVQSLKAAIEKFGSEMPDTDRILMFQFLQRIVVDYTDFVKIDASDEESLDALRDTLLGSISNEISGLAPSSHAMTSMFAGGGAAAPASAADDDSGSDYYTASEEPDSGYDSP